MFVIFQEMVVYKLMIKMNYVVQEEQSLAVVILFSIKYFPDSSQKAAHDYREMK